MGVTHIRKTIFQIEGTRVLQGLANPYFGIGISGSPIDVALTDHIVGYESWLRVTNSIAKSLIGGYFKVETDGSNEATLGQLVAVAPRVTVDMALNSAYGVQSHMTISGTKTSSELISVSAYVDLATGARTADRVCALQAMIAGSGTAGTVVGDAIVAYLVNAGTVITTDDILKLFNQSAATVVDMMELENDGTATNMIRLNNDGATMAGIVFEGAYSIGINMAGCALAVTGRDTAYISMGNYSNHITLDLSSVGASDRFYGMQMYLDSTTNTSAGTWFYAIRPEITVMTNAQGNTNFSGLVPTFNIEQNIGSVRGVMSQIYATTAGINVGAGAFAVSGYLELPTSGTFDTSGALGSAAIIADFAGGTGCTLQSTSRTFALIASTYGNATATDVVLINAGGTVTEAALLVDEYGGVSCPIGIRISAGTKGLVIDHTPVTTAIGINVQALTNVFDFTGCGVAVVEDNKSAPNKAGSIAILTPAGAVAYINYYDGTRS